MHYVLMIHAAESRESAMSKQEYEAMMQAYGQYTRDIFATGRTGDCAALEATSTATSVQVRDGKRVVKDGPFAETREQLGGYYSLDAKDEAEAIAWAARIPGAAHGTIEVRPLFGAGRPAADATAEPAPAKAPPAGSKEFLLLIYEPEARWATMPEAEARATLGRYMDFGASLRAKGQLAAGARLDATSKAKTVRLEGGERVVKDGPFAETREQLGGYYRVHARDLDEAIAMAARIPAAETGTIEIRPVMDTSAYA